jgi:extracellular factor (EF) 3-hydroxypalmitic acid methyl ester biosynthesis protein
MGNISNENGKANGYGSLNPIRQRLNGTSQTQTPASGQFFKETRVTFAAPDNVKLQGVPLHITRHGAVFELVDASFIPRCSETLVDFEIISQSRAIYSGRAVVRNVLNAGKKTVCEVTLAEDFWKEANITAEKIRSGMFRKDISDFTQDWLKDYKIPAEYKIVVADMQISLTKLRDWLNQIELEMPSAQKDALPQLEQELLAELAKSILPYLDGLFKKSEDIAKDVDSNLRPVIQSYMRRQLQPLVINAPFAHRSFHKPLGHAGDYEMMNMIHRNRPEGRSLYDKLIHLLLVSQWPAISVRNRVAHLGENISNETARVARTGKKIRILNIGCGPAWEVQDFIRKNPLSDEAEFTLIDFNAETLAHAGQKANEAKRQFSRRTKVSTQKISVYELLRRTQKSADEDKKYDFIYCAGLFDYLAPDTCRAVISFGYDSLLPGGMLLIANMNDSKPFRNFIEATMEWNLIYRDSREIFSLVPDVCRDVTRVVLESAAVNLFLHTRKPN